MSDFSALFLVRFSIIKVIKESVEVTERLKKSQTVIYSVVGYCECKKDITSYQFVERITSESKCLGNSLEMEEYLCLVAMLNEGIKFFSSEAVNLPCCGPQILP